MSAPTWKRTLTAAVLGVAVSLSACSSEPAASDEPEITAPGLSISDARLVLPPVSGNPAAVYFTVGYDGSDAVTLIDARVSGAGRAMLHKSVITDGKAAMSHAGAIPVSAGEPVVFEPGGLHIMAFDLDEGVVAGGSVEVTLVFEDTEEHTFKAQIRAAGDER